MPIIHSTEELTLTAGGGTLNLDTTIPVRFYIVKGTATLTSNWTIQPSGTAIEGMVYEFKYEADIDLNGNTITLFGTTIPETLVDKTHQITAYYDGTDWQVNFALNVDENGSLPKEIISEYNVADKQEMITIPISFETGYLVKHKVFFPFTGNYTINSFTVSVVKTIEASDDASLKFYKADAATAMTIATGSYAIPAGTTSTTDAGGGVFTSNTAHAEPAYIYVETAKGTPGGTALLYLKITKD